jgi:hypothetical protein
MSQHSKPHVTETCLVAYRNGPTRGQRPELITIAPTTLHALAASRRALPRPYKPLPSFAGETPLSRSVPDRRARHATAQAQQDGICTDQERQLGQSSCRLRAVARTPAQ